MSEYLRVLLTAAAPISEVRGAIPLGLGFYKLPVVTTILIAIIGNMLPVFFILWLLDPVQKYLSSRSQMLARFFDRLFSYTRRRHARKFEIYKEFALVLFVAVPLPMTGAWSGALAAFVFGIPFKKALPLIFLGVVGAAAIVTLASLGVINFILIK